MIVRGAPRHRRQPPLMAWPRAHLAFRGRDQRKFSWHIEIVYQTLKAARTHGGGSGQCHERCPRRDAHRETVAEQQSLRSRAAEEFASEDVPALRGNRAARRPVDSPAA